ncbi:MAG: polynucleotide adenylyltransferase PcnB [Gammaproteobacteria bacterium]|nr:polynucleotide adenylyltransferase PcnB [Gammaproteobacteria bacterium]
MLKKPKQTQKRDSLSTGSPAPGEVHSQISDDPLLAELDLTQISVIPRSQHCISRKAISSAALKVLYKLDAEGYQAFLVGGSIRDLLMGNTPKDFDVATNATPEQLKQLFGNARIIGRRFKIVHIRFGREVIEATTFRAHHKPTVQFSEQDEHRQLKHLDSAHSTSGMILRDNVYGNLNEDAVRRDFTVNALYYTIRQFRILDFSSGIDDINHKLIRMIGDPATRYKEDPVRILRAIRFSAKLGFEIEEHTRKPIDQLAPMLKSIAPARLFDETLKLLSSGYGIKTFQLLQEFEVGRYLFPATFKCLKSSDCPETRLLTLALRNTDSRLAEGKSVTPAFLFAALLWPVLNDELKRSYDDNNYNMQEMQIVANRIISAQILHTAIPKRFSTTIREIWELQQRLQRRNKRSILSAFQHPRFRAAYDFLLLREESGEELDGLGIWWTKFQVGDSIHQTEMINALNRTRRPRRNRHKPAGVDR